MHMLQQFGANVRTITNARMRIMYVYIVADVTQCMQCPKQSTQNSAKLCIAISAWRRWGVVVYWLLQKHGEPMSHVAGFDLSRGTLGAERTTFSILERTAIET